MEGIRTLGRCWQVIGAIAVGGDIPSHRNTACELPCKNIALVEKEDKFHLRKVASKSRIAAQDVNDSITFARSLDLHIVVQNLMLSSSRLMLPSPSVFSSNTDIGARKMIAFTSMKYGCHEPRWRETVSHYQIDYNIDPRVFVNLQHHKISTRSPPLALEQTSTNPCYKYTERYAPVSNTKRYSCTPIVRKRARTTSSSVGSYSRLAIR